MHRAWSKCSNSSWTARPNSYSGRSWKRATSHHCTTLPHNDVFLEIIIIYPCFHGCWLRSACNTNARLRNRREGGEFEAERHGYKGDVYKRRSTHTINTSSLSKKNGAKSRGWGGEGSPRCRYTYMPTVRAPAFKFQGPSSAIVQRVHRGFPPHHRWSRHFLMLQLTSILNFFLPVQQGAGTTNQNANKVLTAVIDEQGPH